MSSIMTNTAAMTALKSLQQTNSSMSDTQTRISTGYRVSEASDNAAYWSIATTMRSDNSALSTVKDALGLGAAQVDIAYTGMNAALKVVDEIKSKITAALQPGVDRNKVQAEITQLQQQLIGIGTSSTVNGENWLSVDSAVTGYSAIETIVSSFNRDASGAVSITTVDISKADVALFDPAGGVATADALGLLDKEYTSPNGAATPVDVIYSVTTLDITAANVDDTVIAAMLSNVDTVFQKMTTAASDLGSSKNRVDMQTQFVSGLMDAIKSGIGKLVDADMTEESTRLQALQVQQQLGIQSLSIANSNAQSILSLFK